LELIDAMLFQRGHPAHAPPYEHFEHRSVSVELFMLIQYAALNNDITLRASKAVAVAVEGRACVTRCTVSHVSGSIREAAKRRAAVTTEAVGDVLPAVRCQLDLLGRALRHREATSWDDDVVAIYGAGVVATVAAVTESLQKGSFLSAPDARRGCALANREDGLV
jgi:hypothetical protein